MRSDLTHYNEPWSFFTSPEVETFFRLCFKTEIGAFAKRLESYFLTGVVRVAENYEARLNSLKTETVTAIGNALGV